MSFKILTPKELTNLKRVVDNYNTMIDDFKEDFCTCFSKQAPKYFIIPNVYPTIVWIRSDNPKSIEIYRLIDRKILFSEISQLVEKHNWVLSDLFLIASVGHMGPYLTFKLIPTA